MKNSIIKMASKASGQEYWTKVIHQCQSSNLSNIEFCRRKGIAISAFYYWKKRLTKLAQSEPMPFLELPGIFENINHNPGDSDVISISIDRNFHFHISFDLKTILPIIREVMGNQK